MAALPMPSQYPHDIRSPIITLGTLIPNIGGISKSEKDIVNSAIRRMGVTSPQFYFSFVLAGSNLHASTEFLTKMTVSFCRENTCYKLNVPDSDRTASSPVFYFDKSELSIFKGKSLASEYESKSGYFDIANDEILLREVTQKHNRDLLIELSTGKETLF